jgi:prepilin signal peptidase PulO-like enzyme (type II secretory pathway)
LPLNLADDSIFIRKSVIAETHPKITPIMQDRRRRALARRLLWIALGLSLLLVVAWTSILIQLYREGYSLRSAYAIQDLLLCRLFEWFLGIWVFIVGSSVASFLNVVAYRVPAGLPVTGTSFCPYCRVPIRPSDNVPVIGWWLLGGRCRACKLSISSRYPIFELIGGLLALSVFLSTVLSHGRNLPLGAKSNLPYGLPVNLYFMDDRLFYVAGLHAWLLFFLYAAALTSFGGGRLPLGVWILGAFGVLGAIAVRPDIFVADTLNWFRTISESIRFQTFQASIFGSIVAMGIAWSWRSRFDQSGWIAACGLVGLTLGWHAAIGVAVVTAVWLFLRTGIFGRSLKEEALRYLWCCTALFLIVWGPFTDGIGILLKWLY